MLLPLQDAWKAACGTSGVSIVIIPKGTYLLGGPITLTGPCKGSITLQVQGTVQAPTSIKGDTWILFNRVDGFKLTGGGTFDGQGQGSWSKSTCANNLDSCSTLAYVRN